MIPAMKEAMLYEALDDDRVRCNLCAHRCTIPDSGKGRCEVRINRGGMLYTLVYGKLIAAHADPIEKKPLYHFLPRSTTYSIATIGCNFKCEFCQNWQISQAGEEEIERMSERNVDPSQVVEEARRLGCASISYTYTEPTIFFEFAYDTARLAHEQGLKNIFVTNGYMTVQALDAVLPFLDAANVDLKSFREDYYRRVCKAHVQPVLDTIRGMKERGIWVEVTTLVVPGENDTDEELQDIARFIADVDPRTPWHISRFIPMYRYADHQPTSLETLDRARRVGERIGLKHVHIGNV